MYDGGIGLPATQIVRPKSADTYPVYTGWHLFEQLTMSGLNKVPTNMHTQRALRGFRADGDLPYKPQYVAEALLVEGSPVFHLEPESEVGPPEWECLHNIITADEDDIYQMLMPYTEYNPNSDCVIRHYHLAGETWTIRDTQMQQWASSGMENEETSGTVPADDLRVYENGRGIIYPNQWMFQRLEEIRWGIRQETSDFALSILLIGMVSPNPEASLAKLQNGARIANIPGGGQVQVARVGDSRIPDQLAEEYKTLEAEYFRACFLFDTSNQPERPVGLDLQLRLEPQAAFVEDLRGHIVNVYRLLDYTGEIKFKPLETKTVADQNLAATTVINLVAAGLMTSQRATQIIADNFPE